MSEATAARDAAAFLSRVDPDAVWAGARGLSRGRAAVLEQWRPFLEPGGATLTWEPEDGGVAASGDLAWTAGTWVWEGTDAGGAPARATGAYATVWRRDASGAWLALFDAGNRPAAEVAPGARRSSAATAASRAGDLAAEIGTWEDDGGRSGAFLAVRVRDGDAWRDAVDAAVPFRR
jgi:ketosteroid isomerase-like protein